MTYNALARYGYGYLPPQLGDSEDYTTQNILGALKPRQGPIANALGIDPSVERDTILPFQSGSWRFAVPQFAVDAINAADRVGTSPLTDRYARTDENRESMTDTAGAVVGPQIAAGFIRNALAKGGGSELGTFGGKLAKTADHNALARAESMDAQGLPREQIWKDTGWFKGVDGKWRFEIDDSAAVSDIEPRYVRQMRAEDRHREKVAAASETWRKAASEFGEKSGKAMEAWSNLEDAQRVPASWDIGSNPTRGRLSDHFNHDSLFQAYPWLRSARLEPPFPDASFYRHPIVPTWMQAGRIGLHHTADTSTVLHELQHGIQNIERTNMDSGRAWREGGKDEYRRMANEVEARTVEKRTSLTPDQRAARPPWLDYDIPESQQIVRFGGSGPQMSLPPGKSLTNALSGEVPHTVVPDGIRAYHGSPHDFDKFDMSKIGTGEGAQAFGHGLYFAENEGVAKGYRDRLAPNMLTTTGNQTDPAHLAKNFVAHAGGDLKAAERQLLREIQAGRELPSFTKPKTPEIGEFARRYISGLEGALERVRSGDVPKPDGHMYEVRINADPKDFLDWDKPLSQQSEKVRGAIDPFVEQEWRRQLAQNEATRQALRRKGSSHGADMMIDPSRSDINMATILQSPETRVAASNKLRDQGIPGIRYLDQGSRSAGEGSHNYVVFDDALVQILRKYGLLPPAVAGALAASNSDPAQARQ